MIYQVLASVNRKFTVFGNVTPCSLVSINKLLPSTLKVEAECFTEIVMSTKLHGVTFHEINVLYFLRLP